MMEDFSFPLAEKCVMIKLDSDVLSHCAKFSCGDEDLDDFFNNDVFLYEKELLGKTYCWIDKKINVR